PSKRGYSFEYKCAIREKDYIRSKRNTASSHCRNERNSQDLNHFTDGGLRKKLFPKCFSLKSKFKRNSLLNYLLRILVNDHKILIIDRNLPISWKQDLTQKRNKELGWIRQIESFLNLLIKNTRGDRRRRDPNRNDFVLPFIKSIDLNRSWNRRG